MRILIFLTIILMLSSCNEPPVNNEANSDSSPDTVITSWEPDYSIYTFDTILDSTVYCIKTYCLNEKSTTSFLFETEKEGTNQKIVEIARVNDYASEIVIEKGTKKITVHILKQTFKDCLDPDFYQICHMWNNVFYQYEEGELIFKATLAKPDTDYQYSVLYSVTQMGKINFKGVIDESMIEDVIEPI